MSRANRQALAAALQNCLPQNVTLSIGQIPDLQAPLFDVEEAAIIKAVQRRRAAFRAGRTCAREALSKLGARPCAVPVASDRQPVWPPGIVGSISHAPGWATAVVASAHDFRGIGVDMEEDAPLNPEVREMICRPEELSKLPPTLVIRRKQIDTGKLVFSIKEAIFKAVYPSTSIYLGFQHACVWFDNDTKRFHARLMHPECERTLGTSWISVRYTAAFSHVIALASIPTRP